MSSSRDKKERDKKRKSQFEAMIFQIMEKSLKAALKAALDDVFKGMK